MKAHGKSERIRERLELKLPARVYCRETPDFEWSEVTRLLDVTPFGAAFRIKRPTERGRLLHITVPLPRQLRVFDFVEDQYKVWAVVRHVRPTTPAEEKTQRFEVGVAFVGKHPPESYLQDPTRRYLVSTGPSQEGMLTIMEPEEPSAPFTNDRTHTRHHIPVALSLETFSEAGAVAHNESTVTENISRRGATVFTGLDIPVGRFVRLTSPEYNLMVHAVVRARSHGPGGMPRIHLEFVDREWPVD